MIKCLDEIDKLRKNITSQSIVSEIYQLEAKIAENSNLATGFDIPLISKQLEEAKALARNASKTGIVQCTTASDEEDFRRRVNVMRQCGKGPMKFLPCERDSTTTARK